MFSELCENLTEMEDKTDFAKISKIEQVIGQLQESFRCPIW